MNHQQPAEKQQQLHRHWVKSVGWRRRRIQNSTATHDPQDAALLLNSFDNARSKRMIKTRDSITTGNTHTKIRLTLVLKWIIVGGICFFLLIASKLEQGSEEGQQSAEAQQQQLWAPASSSLKSALSFFIQDDLQHRQNEQQHEPHTGIISDTAATNGQVDGGDSTPTSFTNVQKDNTNSTAGGLDDISWDDLDLFGTFSLFNSTITEQTTLNFTLPLFDCNNNSETPLLGVTIDAASHYFSPELLYRFVDWIGSLGCINLIHLRLIDSGGFQINLRYKSFAVSRQLCGAVATTHNNDTNINVEGTGRHECYNLTFLREWTRYAFRKYGIKVMPELDILGHAAGWVLGKREGGNASSGFNNEMTDQYWSSLILPCASAICLVGRDIPFNISHPELRPLLTHVLRTLNNVFSVPSSSLPSLLLHLGNQGTMYNIQACLDKVYKPVQQHGDVGDKEKVDEVYYEMTEEYLNKMEDMLRSILRELNISESQIVRGELGRPPSSNEDTKLSASTNNNLSDDGQHVVGWKHYELFDPPREESAESNDVSQRSFFLSHHFEMDRDREEDAFTIYNKTLHRLGNYNNNDVDGNTTHPTFLHGLIVGTKHLDVPLWKQRNVMGRLIPVVMAVASLRQQTGRQQREADDNKDADKIVRDAAVIKSKAKFMEHYMNHCRQMGLHEATCRLGGALPPTSREFASKVATDQHKKMVCNALFDTVTITSLKQINSVKIRSISSSNRLFWERIFPAVVSQNDTWAFGHKEKQNLVRDFAQSDVKSNPSLMPREHTPKRTGIIINLVESTPFEPKKIGRLMAIVDYMSLLGFNTLQLRIMNDHGFGLKIKYVGYTLAFTPGKVSSFGAYPLTYTRKLIERATSNGINVIPEISMTTRAGGWMGGATVPNCPNFLCEKGTIPLNTSDSNFLPVFLAVIRALQADFTSEYIHLGYDEREESMGCFSEASAPPDLGGMERRIEKLLLMHNVSLDKLIRWQNTENVIYPQRVGKITHYTKSFPSREEQGDFFLTNDLDLGDPNSTLKTAWDIYSYVQTILSYRPTGVLAWMGTIENESLHNLNVRQRMLAMAIGLSHPNLNQSSFHSIFNSTCTAAGNRNCNLFGKFRSSKTEVAAQAKAANALLEKTCRVRTLTKVQYVPK